MGVTLVVAIGLAVGLVVALAVVVVVAVKHGSVPAANDMERDYDDRL